VRLTVWITAIILAAVGGFYGVVLLASESGEVVTLETLDQDGRPIATRLWVVDHEGAEWVRAGHPRHRWFVRLTANPRVELGRADSTSRRIAVPVHERATVDAVNREFARKYGVADWIVALSGSAANRVPVRLDRE